MSVLSILSFGAHAKRQSSEPIKVIEPITEIDCKNIELGKRYGLSLGCRRRTSFLVTLAITSRKVVLITY